jgi:8-oxo-dGTP pyrophosphatase MutT (NUDIX family)
VSSEKLFHVGVKALVTDPQGRVLLMEEDGSTHNPPFNNYWDFPGGRMQENESPIETLKREIEEETGITELSEIAFDTATVSNHQIKLKDGKVVGLVLMVYRVKLDHTAKLRLSREHIRYEWVSMAEAKKRLQDKYPKEFTDRL